MLDDFLADAGDFGADSVVLSSASSKTAIGLAHLLSRRAGRTFAVVGLTSARNRAFVEALGHYDRVVTYDDVAGLAPGPAVFVDFSGDAGLLAAVHGHYRDDLRHSALVGLTHGDRPRSLGDLPGPQPEAFSGPARIRQRTRDWGTDGFAARHASAWREFAASAARWLRVERGSGWDAVQRVYVDLLDGRVDPRLGHVLSPPRD